MSRLAILAILLVRAAKGIDVAFMEDKACSGQPLYGSTEIGNVSCYDVSGYGVSQSVLIGNIQAGQVLHFYSDRACERQIHSATTDQCYPQSRDVVGAFSIDAGNSLEKRGTAQPSSSTTDLVEYGVKLSDYTGLSTVPQVSDIAFSNFFLGASALATGGALTFAAGVLGCYGAATAPGPLSIFGCIAGPIATILSYVGYHFLARSGQAINDHIELGFGTISSGNHKRDIINAANFEFLSTAMNVPGSSAVHAGYMKRDLGSGEQTSPIYEIEGGDGVKYHFTAFIDEGSGSFVHHMYPARESRLDKRVGPGYNNVRWSSGGMDFTFCNLKGGQSEAVFQGKSLSTLYNTAYRDLQCLLPVESLKKGKVLLTDMYNGNSKIVAQVNIAPYKKGGPVNVHHIYRCSSQKGFTSQSCKL